MSTNKVTAYCVYRVAHREDEPKLMAFFTNELDAKYYADKCTGLYFSEDTSVKFYVELMK